MHGAIAQLASKAKARSAAQMKSLQTVKRLLVVFPGPNGAKMRTARFVPAVA